MESLYMALKHASKGRRYKPEVLRWNANRYDMLSALQEEIYSGHYEVDKYTAFYVSEPKKRLIMSIAFKHRIVQWAIYQKIQPILVKGYIIDSDGCITDRGPDTAIERVRYWLDSGEDTYYLKYDISKYFYRIDQDVLEETIRKKITDKRLCDLMASVIHCSHTAFGLPPGKSPGEVPLNERIYGVGMPVGNLLSQIFANIYLDRLDQYCKRDLRIRHYIRYMDDGLALSDSKADLHMWEDAIRSYLHDELRLDLNRKTCIRPISQGISYIGYRIWPGYTTVRKSTSKRMKKYLNKTMRDYAAGEIDLRRASQPYMCYKAKLDRCDCTQLREKLLGGFHLGREQ